jgi:hypothetical protein
VNESQGGTEDYELLFREPSLGDADRVPSVDSVCTGVMMAASKIANPFAITEAVLGLPRNHRSVTSCCAIKFPKIGCCVSNEG